jgi:hypothetical protein
MEKRAQLRCNVLSLFQSSNFEGLMCLTRNWHLHALYISR